MDQLSDVHLLLFQEETLEKLWEGKTAATQLAMLNPSFVLSISPSLCYQTAFCLNYYCQLTFLDYLGFRKCAHILLTQQKECVS